MSQAILLHQTQVKQQAPLPCTAEREGRRQKEKPEDLPFAQGFGEKANPQASPAWGFFLS